MSKTGVATFPWDPKPPAQEVNAAPSSAPATSQPPPQANYTQATLSPPQNVATHPPQVKAGPQPASGQVAIKIEPLRNEPVIKQEPGLNNSRPVFNTSQPQTPAVQRAIQNLSNRFGHRAEATISSFHNGQQGSQPNLTPQGQPGQTAQPGHPGQPGQSGQPQQQLNAQQYGQSMAAATAAAMQHAHQPPHPIDPNSLPNSQVDGSSETFDGALMRRDANGNPVRMGRVEIDHLIHSQIAARAKQMEGGGLMLPLKQATKHRSLSGNVQGSQAGAQVDGSDPDLIKEDEDADAINSDLDDPDDDQEEDDDDDDSMGHMMLCMYDKVQRVKNKWSVFIDPHVTRLERLINLQEVHAEGRCAHCEWPRICLPQSNGRI